MSGTVFRASVAVAVPALLGACATVEMELVTFSGAQIIAAAPEPEPPPEVEAPKAVQVSAARITIDEKIQFVTWSAVIEKESYSILDELADVLNANPQIKRVEIQGHTARTGQSKRSLKLSVDRANAVRDYLVKKGVSKVRLSSKGFGEGQPISDNGTEEGREKNRRVEFVILEQDTQAVALANQPAAAEEEEEE